MNAHARFEPRLSVRELDLAEGSRRDVVSRIGRIAARTLRRTMVTVEPPMPMVSFTFDDVPDSAIRNGARLLDAHGCHGTFYLSGGLADASFGAWRFFSRRDVAALLNAGHEIGCHTHNHPDIQTLSADALQQEFEDNSRWLAAIDPRARPTSHAYPYGSIGFARKSQVADRFVTCRGVRPGLNLGRVDRTQLRAYQLYDRQLCPNGLKHLVEETVQRNAWLIFYTHDVQREPTTHGCSPELMARTIDLVLEAGCTVLPVRDAYRLATEGK